jgi:hypothetical protein
MTEIFVFGSNQAGRHGKGAAKFALEHHGAIYGIGIGLQGSSYAIPTKDERLYTLPIRDIQFYVDSFLDFAYYHRRMFLFNVTPIGCGLAGYEPSQIAPMFADHSPNVVLPTEFKEVLSR